MLITWLLFVLTMLSLKQVLCQFELVQTIQNTNENLILFGASRSFRYMAFHNTDNNCLFIYESSENEFGEHLSFELLQKINLDAQIYQRILVSEQHNVILLGALKTSDLKVFRLNQSLRKFIDEKTLHFDSYGVISSMEIHPESPDVVALAFQNYLLRINITRQSSDNILQTINVNNQRPTSLSFSSDGRYLAIGGNTEVIYIYQYNDSALQYQAKSNFWKGEKSIFINFSPANYSKYQDMLIAHFQNSIQIYGYNQSLENFVIHEEIDYGGQVNNALNILISKSPLDRNTVEVYQRFNPQKSQFSKTQSLKLNSIKGVFFSKNRGNLILYGDTTIKIYRYCSIPYCSKCQVFPAVLQSKLTQFQYLCLECVPGFQQKSGELCVHCGQYPSLCKNCDEPNQCTSCIDGYSKNTQSFCIPCHTPFCLLCKEAQVCYSCQEGYAIDEQKKGCRLINRHVSLTGIIIGTVIGGGIVIIIGVYILYRKAQQKKKKEQLFKSQRQKNPIGFRNRARQKKNRKQSLLNSNDHMRVYNDIDNSNRDSRNSDRDSKISQILL